MPLSYFELISRKHDKKAPLQRKNVKLDSIVVHCTDGVGDINSLVDYDLGPNHIASDGCPTVTYHYLITNNEVMKKQKGTELNSQTEKCIDIPAASIVHVVEDEYKTWHAENYNSRSLAVCLMYQTDSKFEQGKKTKEQTNPKNLPSGEMIESLTVICAALMLKYKLSKIVFHREVSRNRTCPGMAIDNNIRIAIYKKVQEFLAWRGHYKANIDGDFGPKSIAANEEFDFNQFCEQFNLGFGDFLKFFNYRAKLD